MPGFLSGVIDRLSGRYPDVVVYVDDVQPTATRYRDLRERNVDLMLGRIFRPFVDDEIGAELLLKDRYFVVTGAGSPWARRRKVTLAELADEAWLHIPPTNPFGSVLAGAFHAEALDLPRKGVITFSQHLRNDLLATGRFLTIMAGTVLRANAERWALKALPIDLKIPPNSVAAFTLKRRTLSPVVELFLEHAREVAKLVAKTR